LEKEILVNVNNRGDMAAAVGITKTPEEVKVLFLLNSRSIHPQLHP